MAITCKKKNGFLIIRPNGDLDQHNADLIRQQMEVCILRHDEAHTVVFDMSGLDFMDSSGIGVLFGRYKNLLRQDKHVYLCGVKPNIDRMLLMSGIYRLMPKIDLNKEMKAHEK